MIKLLRVDERFVHGQVAFAWTNNLGANCIFVASNEIAANNLRKKTLKMAVPTGTKFVVKDMTEAISVLNGEKIKKYQVFLIVGTVEDAYEITQHVPEIKEVNLGNLKKNENRKMITSSVYLNEQELDLVKKMTENGITVQCQAVPTDKKINPLHD
jgi:fructoselysine and glucoselysine-specific PTS system IIB component